MQPVQWLRAIAALMVLVFHLGSVERRYSHGPVLLDHWYWAGEFGIDLFFVISGFIMTASTHADWHKPRKAAPFLLRRILRIYPVYWEFSLMVLGCVLLKPEWVNSSATLPRDILRSFLLLPQPGNPILVVGWSLIHEMYFYLVFCLLFLLPISFRVFVYVWALLTLVAYCFFPMPPGNTLGKIVANPYTLEFISGAVAGVCYLRGVKTPWISAVGLFGLVLFAFGAAHGSNTSHRLPRGILCGTGGAGIIYFASCLRVTRNRLSQLLSGLGDASYSLYLCHVLVVAALGHLWVRLGTGGVSAHIVWIISSIAVSCLVAWLNFCWIERPLHLYVKRRFHNDAPQPANPTARA
ncbi:MAG: acyltransferase [Bryobacteraceae bacterium]